MLATTWPAACYWWIDAVGGFLALTKPRVRIGQVGSPETDIPLFADLSAHHAELCRGESGYVLLAKGQTSVNGKVGTGFLLKDGDRIQMRGVQFVYRQPLAWCLTARLELTSNHRLPMSLDGVVLLGETCMIGPKLDAHIRAEWPETVVLNWHKDRYWIRSAAEMHVDDRPISGWGALESTSHVRGKWGAFRFEPATS